MQDYLICYIHLQKEIHKAFNLVTAYALTFSDYWQFYKENETANLNIIRELQPGE